MAVSPVGREMFLVDVKGYRRNMFLVKRTPANACLYYILAFVPDGAPNVLRQATAGRLIEQGLQTLGRADGYPVTGIEWDRALEREGRWDVLPK
jgi:hypothetical protein